jgi:hypothetical protein
LQSNASQKWEFRNTLISKTFQLLRNDDQILSLIIQPLRTSTTNPHIHLSPTEISYMLIYYGLAIFQYWYKDQYKNTELRTINKSGQSSWLKYCMEGVKVATPPYDVPVDGLVHSHGEILDTYRGADKSLDRSTSRFILFDY